MRARGAHGVRDWDVLAQRFDERVCHVLAEDRGRVVEGALAAEARRLARLGRPVLAGDFGCGTGRALRLLLRLFGSLIAFDHSAACLSIAAARARAAEDVSFVQADLCAPRLRLPGVDVGLCVNVAIMPGERARSRLLRNVARGVRRGGRLFLVVPALESELLVRRVVADLDGTRPRAVRGDRLVEGIADVGGAPTKLWTREEILRLAPRLSCRAIAIERIEYGWRTELERPPRRLGAPFPWDWLAVLERGPGRGAPR